MSIIKSALVFLAISFMLTGCFGSKPVKVKTEAVERLPLALNEPKLENLEYPRWHVITPENSDGVWEELAAQKDDEVLIGLTDEGYITLSELIKKVINQIEQQKLIIKQYKEYYEPEN